MQSFQSPSSRFEHLKSGILHTEAALRLLESSVEDDDPRLLRAQWNLAFRRTQLELARHDPLLRKYSEDQPRIPLGQFGAGRWTDGSGAAETGTGAGASSGTEALGGFPIASAALFRLGPELLRLLPTISAGLTALGKMLPLDGLSGLYDATSSFNSPLSQGILEFTARGYEGGLETSLDFSAAKVLSREEVQAACPRIEEVQAMTDVAYETTKNDQLAKTPQAFGTEVHKRLKDQIDSLGDPTLRAEVSSYKSMEEAGFRKGIRIDVLEERPDGTACVYDIKTGMRGLGRVRMDEIAGYVRYGYRAVAGRIIVTEIRPSGGPLGQ